MHGELQILKQASTEEMFWF